MARFDILGLQYFTDGGELLGGGKLNFYETGTTTRKNTFSNAAMTIANTNPVTLDADGRAPNIFFSGLAKCVLTDSTGVVLETKDPVGSIEGIQNAFAEWSPDITYGLNHPVTGSNGIIYTSLVAPNIGNNPLSSPSQWQLFVKEIGLPDTPNGNVLVIDTAAPQKVGSVTQTSIRVLVPISTATANNSATIDFTGITSAYSEYEVRGLNIRPVNDGRELLMRTSLNGGVSYDSGASDYSYVLGGTSSAASSWINVSTANGNDGIDEPGSSFRMTLVNPSNNSFSKIFYWQVATVNASSGVLTATGTGRRTASSSAVSAIRFFFDAGNISSGIFTLYGVSRT